MYTLVLFDLDGTLIDSAPEIRDAVNGFLRECALPEQSHEAVLQWIGQGSRELMIRAWCAASGESTAALRADAERADRLMAQFSEHYAAHSGRNSQPYPGVLATLARLKGAGIALGIVTNKFARYTGPALAAHGLQDYFGLVLSGDTLSTRKPQAGPILHALAHFGVARERCLFVGDSETDVATARNAEVAVWAVPYGYNGGRPIAEAKPDRVLREFAELGEILRTAAA